jgi:hypothetical protein
VESICLELRRVADQHCAESGSDAFCVFLRVHHCICESIERGEYSSAIKQINVAFVHRCFMVYENFRLRRFGPGDLSDNWVVALAAYCDKSQSYVTVLPQMARAHILDDLPVFLYDTPVQKDDFDEVIEAISRCLDDALRHIDPTGRLLLKAGSSIAVPMLRELAWKKVERRRGLAAKARRLQDH